MHLTVFSLLIIGAIFGLMKYGVIPPYHYEYQELTLIITGLVFFLTVSVTLAITYIPRVRAQKYLPTTISSLVRKNPLVVLAHVYTFVFPLLSLALAGIHTIWALALWFVLLALAIDSFGYYLRKISATFSSSTGLEAIYNNAVKTLPKDNTSELCESFDALSEVALKSIDTKSILNGKEAIEYIRELSQEFFRETRKKKFTVDSTGKNLDVSDRVNFTLSYLIQDFDMLYSKVINEGIEPVANEIILSLGKIALYAARADVSFAQIPLRTLGKYALFAQHKGYSDVVFRAIITLNQVGRLFLTEQDVLLQDLKEIFLTIVSLLEDITKDSFKRDKSTKISVLQQPFNDLRAALKDPRLANRDDIQVIDADIGRVLGEFDALEMVVGGMSAVPDFGIPPSGPTTETNPSKTRME
jgi:hypothetical protein